MKMYYVRLFAICAFLFCFIGCASTIPLTSTLVFNRSNESELIMEPHNRHYLQKSDNIIESAGNENVSKNIKINGQQAISLNYSSDISDTKFYPYCKDKSSLISSHPGYLMEPSTILKKMLQEYMGIKFTKLNDSCKSSNITINFKDFWIEEITQTDITLSYNKPKIYYSPSGPYVDLNSLARICVANAKIEVKLLNNNQETIKFLSASVEEISKEGRKHIEYVHAKNINDCFNNLIKQINSFLEENKL